MTEFLHHKVLISDDVHEICKTRLEAAGIEVDYRPGIKGAELLAALKDCTGLVVRSATRVTGEIIAAGPKLQVIGRAGVGVDNIDVEEATHHGIAVLNTPEGNTTSAAEHTIGMMMALSRNIPQACAAMKAGKWSRSAFTGTEVRGKVLGVIGLGKIGREVARRARGLDMNVVCYDPMISPAAAEATGAQLLPLDAVLEQADYLTLHIPSNANTHHLLDADRLNKCKTGVRIINCARGEIIDTDALLDALNSGKVAGAALDVFENEPPDMTAPIIQHPHTIVTPHLGASTAEAQHLVAEQIGQLVAEALTTGTIRNAINMFPMDRQTYERAKPFLRLAERLGSLQAQVCDGQPVSLTLEYFGDVLEHPTGLLTASVLVGMLKQLESGTVNLVNAPVLAQERGIRVDEMRRTGDDDYNNVVTVTYQTRLPSGETLTRRIAGSVFGEDSPRVVRIDGHSCDVIPEGRLLIMWNRDVPGVIGEVATVLGAHNVNIAFGSYGRDVPGGLAVMVYVLDSDIEESTVDTLRKLKNLHTVKYARLA
ncbi:MAG TPA: phosphoglycerate dehydrogenase [Candidatus Latescibacteria bacterium]|nr:phosphoglycerate dehydrogenase [Candidatus Latescibacterota bacterium]HOF60525.1 phosphoglycerate dehydrogenase [Candidatus Latescibacterota bacterium]HOS63773.1 phosphoglycerate dehydrogenase [Candidatus Latescibacterota bacterium]HPK75123.1 phosphoglycerate dehydrogenase [Candidatus Latescibacterota bacterium]